jgi:hypothetical protein
MEDGNRRRHVRFRQVLGRLALRFQASGQAAAPQSLDCARRPSSSANS